MVEIAHLLWCFVYSHKGGSVSSNITFVYGQKISLPCT